MKIKKRHRLTAAIDIDDVLFPCSEYAVSLINKEERVRPPLSLEEITSWGKTGGRTDLIFEHFENPSFFESQPVYKGAKDFIKKLSHEVDILVLTAIKPAFMGIRINKIKKAFPDIPEENIMMGHRKELVDVDILLDDSPANILSSRAKYPVLMRRPWNQHITGILSVNSYSEFLRLVKEIKNSYTENHTDNGRAVISLVGPSGTGKTQLANEILKDTMFKKPISYTTQKTKQEEGSNYVFVPMEEFLEMKNRGEFFESTMYGNEGYATKKEDIQKVLDQGCHAVIPLDMCGTIAMKDSFHPCVSVFIKKDKKTLIEKVIERDYTNEEKVNRILSIDAELKNEGLCDYTIENHDINSSLQAFLSIFE